MTIWVRHFLEGIWAVRIFRRPFLEQPLERRLMACSNGIERVV